MRLSFTLLVLLSCQQAAFADESHLADAEARAAELRAVKSLGAKDAKLYVQQKPMQVIWKRFEVSNFSRDESRAKLIAVQRTKLDDVEGWRMVLLGHGSLLIFHVSSDGKERMLVRQELNDLPIEPTDKDDERNAD